MTKDEFKQIVKGLKAIYTDPKFIADQFAFDMWYAVLADIPYKEASIATQRCIQSQSFQPMPADIRKYVAQNRESEMDVMSELEAWNMVLKASSNGTYGSQEEFEKLPKAIQMALGNHVSLKEMATMDYDNLNSVEKSHFIRNYRATLEKLRDEQRLTPELNKAVKEIGEEYNPTPVIENETPVIEDKYAEKPKSDEKPLSESVQRELDALLGRL